MFDRWQFSAGIKRQMLERLGGNLNAFYGEGQYDTDKREDKFTGASIELTYDINRSTQGVLSYNYSKTDSNVATSGYTRNYASAGIKMEF
jgi:uncharacterized protein (PEP-CTERM system associated)